MKRNVIIFFILTLFLLVPSVYAGDFWIDASDVYNTIRTLDSKLGMGISGAEFKRKFEDITVSYDLFMDKYSDKCSLSRYLAMLEKKATGKKKAKIQAEAEYFHENELSFCETLSLVKDQFRLALSS